MNQYEVYLMHGGPEPTTTFDVEADFHRIEKPDVHCGASAFSNEAPLFIVFYYTKAPIVLDPLAPAQNPGYDDASANTETTPDAPTQEILYGLDTGPVATAFTDVEVFRAPLHALLAVRLVDDEEEETPA